MKATNRLPSREALWARHLVMAALLVSAIGGAQAQDFLANKKFAPTDISANSQSTLTFDFFNTSGGALDAAVTDTLPETTPPGQLWFSPADVALATLSGPGCTGGALALSDFLDAPAGTKAQTLSISGLNLPYVPGSTDPACQLSIPVHSGDLSEDSNLINSVPQGGAYAMGGSNRLESDPFSATLRVRAPTSPFAVGKRFAPATIPAGGRSTLTITVKNNEPEAKSNVGFNDALPAGLTLLETPEFSGSCGPATTPSAMGSSSLSVAGATVAPGGTCTVTALVEAGAAASGALLNTIPAGAVSDGSSSNVVPAQSTLYVRSQIKMTKAFMSGSSAKTNLLPEPGNLHGRSFTTGAASVVVGQAVPVRVYFNNPLPRVLTGGTLTDTLPAGVVAVASEVGGTCGWPTPKPSLAANATTVALNGFTVPAANLSRGSLGSCYVEFWVKATSALGTTTNALNTSDVGFGGISGADIDAATSADLSFTGSGSGGALSLTKTFFNDARTDSHTGTTGGLQVAKGEAFWMRVNAFNRLYDTTYSQVVVSDLLPNGVRALQPLQALVQTNPDGETAAASCAVNGSVAVADEAGRDRVSFSGASVPGAVGAAATNASLNQGCFFWIKLVSNQSGGYQNTIGANTVTTAQGVSNPSAVNARVAVTGDFNASKRFSPNQIGANGGAKTRLVLSFDNSTAQTPITNLAVTDALPGSAAFGYLQNSQVMANTCAATVSITPGAANSSDRIDVSGGTVAAGGACQIEVELTHNGGNPLNFGKVTNRIPANAITNDQNQTNPLELTAELSQSDLGISVVKSFPVSSAFGGQSVPLTLRFAATSSSSLPQGNISITDYLPAGMLIASDPNLATTCKNEDGSAATQLTMAPGQDAFTFSGFYFSAYGDGQDSCDMTIDVFLSSTGNKVNSIPAGAITTDAGTTNASATEASLSALVNTAVQIAFAPRSIKARETSTLTLSVINVGTGARTGFELTNTLPAGLAIAPTPSASTSCSNGTVTAVPGGNALSIRGADVEANASCAISVQVSARAGTYVNDADDLRGSAYLDISPAKDILTVEDDGSMPPGSAVTPVASLNGPSIVALSLMLLVWVWRNRRRAQR